MNSDDFLMNHPFFHPFFHGISDISLWISTSPGRDLALLGDPGPSPGAHRDLERCETVTVTAGILARENHGKTMENMGKPWKTWENHGKTIGKP